MEEIGYCYWKKKCQIVKPNSIFLLLTFGGVRELFPLFFLFFFFCLRDWASFCRLKPISFFFFSFLFFFFFFFFFFLFSLLSSLFSLLSSLFSLLSSLFSLFSLLSLLSSLFSSLLFYPFSFYGCFLFSPSFFFPFSPLFSSSLPFLFFPFLANFLTLPLLSPPPPSVTPCRCYTSFWSMGAFSKYQLLVGI